MLSEHLRLDPGVSVLRVKVPPSKETLTTTRASGSQNSIVGIHCEPHDVVIRLSHLVKSTLALDRHRVGSLSPWNSLVRWSCRR